MGKRVIFRPQPREKHAGGVRKGARLSDHPSEGKAPFSKTRRAKDFHSKGRQGGAETEWLPVVVRRKRKDRRGSSGNYVLEILG